ncbi:WxcM-like domain-containing protein [Qipengyuania sp. CAU 1752]
MFSFSKVSPAGVAQRRFYLNRSYQGLVVVPMIWRELDNFSSGLVRMVLASNGCRR